MAPPTTMTFSDYQEQSRQYAIYPRTTAIEYVTLGLASEAGEVCGKVKKVLRDHQGDFNDERCAAIGAEIADCTWYLAQLATELGLNLDELAAANIAKLQDRQARGVLGGSGDQR